MKEESIQRGKKGWLPRCIWAFYGFVRAVSRIRGKEGKAGKGWGERNPVVSPISIHLTGRKTLYAFSGPCGRGRKEKRGGKKREEGSDSCRHVRAPFFVCGSNKKPFQVWAHRLLSLDTERKEGERKKKKEKGKTGCTGSARHSLPLKKRPGIFSRPCRSCQDQRRKLKRGEGKREGGGRGKERWDHRRYLANRLFSNLLLQGRRNTFLLVCEN